MRSVFTALQFIVTVSLVPAALAETFWNDKEAPLTSAERKASLQAGCPTVSDRFEKALSEENWNPKFVKPKERFEIQSVEFSEGNKALSVELKKDDEANTSGKYKHELRIANDKRCNFGQEVWYSFSFFIDGNYPSKGSTRWVIGQWKEESGASPFLAQRFDNGVFHVSIQRNENREIVAFAPGDFDAKFAFFSDEFTQSIGEPGNQADDNKSGFAETVRDFGPSAFDLQSLNDAITDQDISKFPFVADPEDYSRIEDLSIELSEQPFLPDPSNEWVHMRYRVKGDRNGQGLIEIWANDVFIARVTGKIGNDEFEGPTQYFKFGHYRDVDSEFQGSRIYLDNFKRGREQGDVD